MLTSVTNKPPHFSGLTHSTVHCGCYWLVVNFPGVVLCYSLWEKLHLLLSSFGPEITLFPFTSIPSVKSSHVGVTGTGKCSLRLVRTTWRAHPELSSDTVAGWEERYRNPTKSGSHAASTQSRHGNAFSAPLSLCQVLLLWRPWDEGRSPRLGTSRLEFLLWLYVKSLCHSGLQFPHLHDDFFFNSCYVAKIRKFRFWGQTDLVSSQILLRGASQSLPEAID